MNHKRYICAAFCQNGFPPTFGQKNWAAMRIRPDWMPCGRMASWESWVVHYRGGWAGQSLHVQLVEGRLENKGRRLLERCVLGTCEKRMGQGQGRCRATAMFRKREVGCGNKQVPWIWNGGVCTGDHDRRCRLQCLEQSVYRRGRVESGGGLAWMVGSSPVNCLRREK